MNFSFRQILVFLLLVACTNGNKTTTLKINNVFYDKAFDFRENMNTDSAFLYFNKAKEVFLQQKDSLGVGKCLVNMAIISTDKGDFFGGQEVSLSAISYFNQKNEKHHRFINSNYNNLGLATYRLEDYDKAITFYDLAIKFSKDSLDIRMYLNNKANAYRELKNYKMALEIYDEILAGKSKNPKEYARTLTNIAYTKWLQNPMHNSVPDLLKALHIREKENDNWGLNASYASLSDYYSLKRLDSAFFYAHKMLLIANTIQSADDQLQALQKLIKLSPKSTKQYFDVYKAIKDSLQTARNRSKNQFALIRYETEKHKADNLVLQKQNTEKKYQIIIIATISLLTLTIGLFWYKKHRQTLRLETAQSIKDSQLKTSKKVHDIVANGLYRVMTEIENEDNLDKERILDRIEDMYEKSRDISYDWTAPSQIGFQDKINNLLRSFKSPSVDIKIEGNTKALWQKTSSQVQYEIENILQELMVNMVKHSQATSVSLLFEQNKRELSIHYQDNGIGISKSTPFKNGLTNTGNRINNISGSITFDLQTEKGLDIHISFPVS